MQERSKKESSKKERSKQKSFSLSLFSVANFFIRSMKYHERMTLLAAILFIPLLTFAYLFISKNSQDLQHIESKIEDAHLNMKLIRFVKELQEYRGISYTFQTQDIMSVKLNKIEGSIHLLADNITKIYQSLKIPLLKFKWEAIETQTLHFLAQSKQTKSLNDFIGVSKLIQEIHLLIEQNQAQFKIILQDTMQMHVLERILFQAMPHLLENSALLRGLMTNVLYKKSINTKELNLIDQNYYTSIEKILDIRSTINYYHIKDKHTFLTPVHYKIFDQALKAIHHKDFTLDSAVFFTLATKVINQSHSFIDKMNTLYLSHLNEIFKAKKQTFNYLVLLLVVALFLAIYIYSAIYILAKRHLRKLQEGALYLKQRNYSHEIIINSHDELSDIADCINQLALTLKFDIELIDRYIPMSKTNVQGVITEVNNAFCHLTGYSKEELIGKTHALLRHPENSDEYFKHFWQTILTGTVWDAELLNKHKDGHDIWVTLHIIPTKNKKGETVGFTSLHKDITEKKKALQLAIIDHLTGIYNREHFNKILDMDIERAKRYNYNFCLIMIDLDNFKHINDNYGHLEGDEILKRFSQLILSMLRTTDTFARWGGEEFMILLPYTPLDQAITLAESLRATVENYCKGAHRNTSISLGVTSFNPLQDDKNEIISRCDKYLYKAKELGRNRVVSQ